jgi:hypothetical protein
MCNSICRFTILVVFCLARPATIRADLVRNISSGLDASGTSLIAPNSIDGNYTIIGPPGPTLVTYFAQARTESSLPFGYANNASMPGSQWLYVVADPLDTSTSWTPSGNYIFRTTVDLAGFDVSTASIRKLQVATDNFFQSIAINGKTILTRAKPSGVVEEYWAPLTVGEFLGLGEFQNGINTIDFVTYNQGFGGGTSNSPNALRILANIEATAVPEPTSILLAGFCACGLVCRFRKRRIDLSGGVAS